LLQDTLWFLPGNAESTTVSITIVDAYGNPPEIISIVNLSIDDSTLGHWTYLNPELADTVDFEGRINFIFTTLGIEGDVVFTASVAGITATRGLAIRVIPTVIDVEIGPTPLQAEVGQEDTIRFNVLYTTATGVPLADRQLMGSAVGGRFDPLPLTDEMGQTIGRFYNNDDFVDVIRISVTDGYAVGTDSVVISIGGD
jgi:hypothetical protein